MVSEQKPLKKRRPAEGEKQNQSMLIETSGHGELLEINVKHVNEGFIDQSAGGEQEAPLRGQRAKEAEKTAGV